MVEVFKTTIQKQTAAMTLLKVLSRQFPLLKINIDLDDCDKVLRVEGHNISPKKIIEILHVNGYQCEMLE